MSKEAQDNGARPASELTKRERMAMAAMQGFCAGASGESSDTITRWSVWAADALLAELAKSKDGAE